MKAIILTPEKAFRAIHELKLNGKRVSGRAVWQHCGAIGSLSTAVKWVRIAEAIAQGDSTADERLVGLWEAIAQGQNIEETEIPANELPSPLRDWFERFSHKVAIAIQEAVDQGIHCAQQTAADEIEKAEAEVAIAQERCGSWERELQHQGEQNERYRQTIEQLKNQVTSVRARCDELERQLNRTEDQKSVLESANRELSQHVGMLSEKIEHLDGVIEELREQERDLQSEMQDLRNSLKFAQEKERVDATKLRGLERDNAVVKARLQDLQQELERELQAHSAANERVTELSEALIRKTGEASAAVERAAQFEARIAELKHEMR